MINLIFFLHNNNSEHFRCLGVLSEYLQQESILEEQSYKPAEDEVHIDLPTWEGIKNEGEDAWLALPPKRRRQILDEGLIEKLTVSTKKGCSIENEKSKELAEAFWVSIGILFEYFPFSPYPFSIFWGTIGIL